MEYAAVVAALGTGLRRVCSKGKTTLPPTARKWIGTPRYATLKTYSVIQKSQISEMITDQYNDGSTLYTLCRTGQSRIMANHKVGTVDHTPQTLYPLREASTEPLAASAYTASCVACNLVFVAYGSGCRV